MVDEHQHRQHPQQQYIYIYNKNKHKNKKYIEQTPHQQQEQNNNNNNYMFDLGDEDHDHAAQGGNLVVSRAQGVTCSHPLQFASSVCESIMAARGRRPSLGTKKFKPITMGNSFVVGGGLLREPCCVKL